MRSLRSRCALIHISLLWFVRYFYLWVCINQQIRVLQESFDIEWLEVWLSLGGLIIVQRVAWGQFFQGLKYDHRGPGPFDRRSVSAPLRILPTNLSHAVACNKVNVAVDETLTETERGLQEGRSWSALWNDFYALSEISFYLLDLILHTLESGEVVSKVLVGNVFVSFCKISAQTINFAEIFMGFLSNDEICNSILLIFWRTVFLLAPIPVFLEHVKLIGYGLLRLNHFSWVLGNSKRME